MNLTLRQATFTDIDALVNLLMELCEIEEDFIFNPQKQLKGLELLLASDKDCIIVAEHNAEIIAMCTMQSLISTAEGGHVGLRKVISQ